MNSIAKWQHIYAFERCFSLPTDQEEIVNQAYLDPSDYDQVKETNGRYVMDDLEQELYHGERADLI